MRPLRNAQLYRALLASDARFDGIFYVGVTSTRIYCRPVCRAPKPKERHCLFFASAAAAERRGFRPCLRCRPELAPGTAPTVEMLPIASVDAVPRLARAAAELIASGALDRGNLEMLAAKLGVSGRHVRRALERELGATPVELAQTRRLLTAKQLLSETQLPLSQIALASGFQSVRRFNALFSERYRLAPGALRRGIRVNATATSLTDAGRGTIQLTLAFRPPFDWGALLRHLEARATPGVEFVSVEGGGVYMRTVSLHGCAGVIGLRLARPPRARPRALHGDALRLELSSSLLPVLVPLLARVRRMCDLDADPATIGAHLRADPALAPLVAHRPGLRVPGTMDPFELAWRTVLGQQVSVRGATTLAGRLASLGEPLPANVAAEWGFTTAATITRLPVSADRIAQIPVIRLTAMGLTRARAECVIAIARSVADGTLPELVGEAPTAHPLSFTRRFRELPGIGPWTAEYVVMRALRWPDAFPQDDLVLRRRMGDISPRQLQAAAERWRPWRAYAAQYLWTGAADPVATIASKLPGSTRSA
jgi:AraC family transcriptional regulator, regulatory protein of adaptative response / DNA-3-methyladenine glycosylase II